MPLRCFSRFLKIHSTTYMRVRTHNDVEICNRTIKPRGNCLFCEIKYMSQLYYAAWYFFSQLWRSSISRDDYQLPSTGQTLFPNDCAIIWNVCNQFARVCSCKRRSSGGDEMLRAAAPTRIRSISQFSSGYDVKPPRPPESGMLPYVIALPISPRGNRGYKRNDNDAALISPACTLCFAIPGDIGNNTQRLDLL